MPAVTATTRFLAPDDPGRAFFYISAIDGPQAFMVAGPFTSKADAESRVAEVRNMAADPDINRNHHRAHWMAWGVCTTDTPITTPLGRMG